VLGAGGVGERFAPDEAFVAEVAKAGLIDPSSTGQVVLGHDPERPDRRERSAFVLVKDVIAFTTFEAFARPAAPQIEMSVQEVGVDGRTVGPNLRRPLDLAATLVADVVAEISGHMGVDPGRGRMAAAEAKGGPLSSRTPLFRETFRTGAITSQLRHGARRRQNALARLRGFASLGIVGTPCGCAICDGCLVGPDLTHRAATFAGIATPVSLHPEFPESRYVELVPTHR
jgi:hypothetical protein